MDNGYNIKIKNINLFKYVKIKKEKGKRKKGHKSNKPTV